MTRAVSLDRARVRPRFAFIGVLEPHNKLLNDFVGLLDPARFIVLAPIPPAIAIVRRRPRLAAAAVGVIGGATLTTEVLKYVAVAPRFPAGGDLIAWPSGHMTAATALALAFVLVVPESARGFAAAAGVLWVVAIAGTILLLGTHLASDVVSGMLVAGAWAGLALAGLRAWTAPASVREEHGRSR
jgi:membrane-associated phospholipid phosphatase